MLTKSCSWIFSQNFDSELFLAFLKREFSAFVNIPNSHLNFSVDIDNFFDRRSFDQTKEIMTNNLWLIIDEVSNRLYKLNSLLKSWVQIGPFNKQFSGQKRSENDKNRVFPGYLACYPIIFSIRPSIRLFMGTSFLTLNIVKTSIGNFSVKKGSFNKIESLGKIFPLIQWVHGLVKWKWNFK